MKRRRFLLTLGSLIGMVGGGIWFASSRDTIPRAAPVVAAVPYSAIASPGTPTISPEAAQIIAVLGREQGRVNFPMAAPTDLTDFVPPKGVDVTGPDNKPIVIFYLGYKPDPAAAITFAQSVAGFGIVEPFPKSLTSSVVTRQIKLLNTDATLVTAIHNQSGMNLVQLQWAYSGRQYWVEAKGVPTERLLAMVGSVTPLR